MTPKNAPFVSRRDSAVFLDGRLLMLAATSLLVIFGASLLGAHAVSWREIIGAADGRVYWQLRVPRVLLGAVAGAGLAVGGLVLQILFRNPLATPYTLGISSGASMAAAIGLLCGLRGRIVGSLAATPLLAFAGAMAAIALIYAMSRLRGGRDMGHLLLTGVCVSAIASAGVILATYLADATITNEIVRWMMGSLIAVDSAGAVLIGVVLAPGLFVLISQHRALDLLLLGDVVAASRGASVGAVIWSCLLLVGLLTAVIVAHCGPIGFVGLIVPHLMRSVVGPRTLRLLVACPFAGAAFLTLCDGVGRTISIYEIPVGVLTNVLGAGFFFYLLTRREYL